MTLRFILGRAGTGKTHTCLKEISTQVLNQPEGKEIIFLVPEQATFQMEHALAAIPSLGGIMRVQVLSFRRLAWRVFSETGGNARVPIGELGKRMALRNLLTNHQDKLQVFGQSAGRFGFVDTLARALGEMKTYCVTPRSLGETNKILPDSKGLIRGKLADLQLLYEELESFLAGKYTDPDDYLTYLAGKLQDSAALRGAEIWIDGFTGFTPQEYLVLQSIFKVAERVNIALCLDPGELGEDLAEEELFYPTRQTYQDISALAQEAGVTVENPLVLMPQRSPRFSSAMGLDHLEKNYFTYPAAPFREEVESIKIIAAANLRAEVEAVAREIVSLCREQGWRWRDSALILRDLEPYHELIATVFQDYQIPFFIDHKRPVMHHPLVELIRSALEVVISDWTYEPVFRCLKTDLIPITRERIDCLENYVLAHGIKGSKWTGKEDWLYRRHYSLGEDEELSEDESLELVVINETRRQAVGALKTFAKKTRQSPTVRELTTGLYFLLEDLKVNDTLIRWSQEAEQAGDLVRSKEHIQIWGAVMDLLDEIVEALGELELSPQDYLEVLDAGLESLKLGLIPPGLDQVLVGSLDRSRNPNVKGAFILGASDGVLPARPVSNGLFNDAERETLEQKGLRLASGGRRRTFDEQYLIYNALTRAGEFLWVSYPLADEEGRNIAPSPVIARLKEIFPLIKETFYQVEPQEGRDGDPHFVARPKGSLSYLGARLREAKGGHSVNGLWWDVYNWFCADSRWQGAARQSLAGLFHLNQEKPIPQLVSKKLYGQPLRASVSRIERYKACPFAHFANYGLRLKERPVNKLAAPDLGEFLHAALKGFADVLVQEGLDWGQLDKEKCAAISGQVVEDLAPQLQSEILLSTARYRYITKKLAKITTRATVTLAEHARRSPFRPVGLELSFGPQGNLPPLTIELSEGKLELNGRIDRIDLARVGDKVYLRVIDYKSSDNQLKLPDIYHGLKLQLLTYLHVALTYGPELAGQDCLPGGIFYFTLKEPLLKNSGPLDLEKVEADILGQLKMNGYLLGEPEIARLMDNRLESGWSELFKVALTKEDSFHKSSQVVSGEQFALLRKHLEKVFVEAGEEILGGQIQIAPYQDKKGSACTFCTYKPVCKFDLLLEDNFYRRLQVYSDEALWQEIQGKEG